MTPQSDILNDPKYIPCLDHGFVGYIDHMGSDQLIEHAARVSYDKVTRKISDTRSLLRYMLRHGHNSPFEQNALVFHIKLPIFVMNQWGRYRTASRNEHSNRYSEASEECFSPQEWRKQSTTNKQGSSKEILTGLDSDEATMSVNEVYKKAIDTYHQLLKDGVSKELARIVMPMANYTECYWKCDLHNIFHVLEQRLDSHAQKEIRVYAEAMYKLVQPLFPLSCEAFEDYERQAIKLSRMDIAALKDLIEGNFVEDAAKYGWSEREMKEFVEKWVNHDEQ
jgi:thymidylate synthase (FAD)